MPQMTEYTFSLSEIKSMIARELNVPERAVTVTYSIDDTSDDRYPDYVVSGVKVTVDNTKIYLTRKIFRKLFC